MSTTQKQTLTALLVLNVVLLAALALIVVSPKPAEAQGLGGGGAYTMLAGEATGLSQQQAVYIIDTRRSGVVAVSYSSADNNLRIHARRAIANDFTGNRGGGRGGRVDR